MARWVAMVETDLAQFVRAEDALKELHAIRLRLCFQRPSDDMLERYSEALSDIAAALQLGKLAVQYEGKARQAT